MSDPRYPGRPGPYAGQQPSYPPYEHDAERTTQLPAFNYDSEPPPTGQPPGLFAGSSALLWTLRALGLIAVAVISGLVWYYITNDDSATPSQGSGQPTDQGKYAFVAAQELPQPVRDSNCVEHSRGKVQEYLRTHQCTGLVRQLYTTRAPDGRTAYVSVSAVQMGTAADAAGLQNLTRADNTGNIKDLVLDGKAKVSGLRELDVHGGYASKELGAKLVIVEGDFSADASNGDEPLLDDICEDALRFGPGLN